MNNYFLLFGPPGVGKGTQAQLLASYLNIPHISVGDIFRQHIREETNLGLKVKQIINNGNLVPDELTIELVNSKLLENLNGFVLDGYPRTLVQAEALNTFFNQKNLKIRIIELTAQDDIIITRLSSRRVCKKCNHVYNLISNPPQIKNKCDSCNEKLYKRDDDSEVIIKERLEIYYKNTAPILEFYKNDILQINGIGEIQEISLRIRKGLD